MFLAAGIEVYEGMIVGENSRSEDMDVNPTKEKKLTNMRARRPPTTPSGSRRPPSLTLEQALEFIADDECVEVTPDSVRLRKTELDRSIRGRLSANAKRVAAS